jgi:hypothetical protein
MLNQEPFWQLEAERYQFEQITLTQAPYSAEKPRILSWRDSFQMQYIYHKYCSRCFGPVDDYQPHQMYQRCHDCTSERVIRQTDALNQGWAMGEEGMTGVPGCSRDNWQGDGYKRFLRQFLAEPVFIPDCYCLIAGCFNLQSFNPYSCSSLCQEHNSSYVHLQPCLFNRIAEKIPKVQWPARECTCWTPRRTLCICNVAIRAEQSIVADKQNEQALKTYKLQVNRAEQRKIKHVHFKTCKQTNKRPIRRVRPGR